MFIHFTNLEKRLVRSRNYNINTDNYGNKGKYGRVNNRSSRMNIALEVKGLISPILTNPEFSQQSSVKETKYETSRKSAQRERSCPKWVVDEGNSRFSQLWNAPKNYAFRPQASLYVLFDSHNTQSPSSYITFADSSF